ncbi:MAG: hypothetical protein RSC25_07535 [Christensenella sp.]
MKKATLLGIVFILALALCSCAISPAEKYENFVNDLDVQTRLQTGLQQMSGGGMTAYVAADMRTLEKDLSTLNTHDEQIFAINENFINSARELQKSAELLKADPDGSFIAYKTAKSCFDAGEKAFYSLDTGHGALTNG